MNKNFSGELNNNFSLSCPFKRARNSDSCVLKLVVSSDDIFEDFFVFIAKEPEWKTLDPFLFGDSYHKETLIVMSEWEFNSLDIIHDCFFFELNFIQTVNFKLKMMGRIKRKLIISFLTWILLSHLAVWSPKILWFFNVSNYGHVSWTTCSEVGIHHYCIVVVCLSV